MKIQLAIAICENYIFNHQKHSGISYGNISNAKFRSGYNLGLDNANWVGRLDARVFGENFIGQKADSQSCNSTVLRGSWTVK